MELLTILLISFVAGWLINLVVDLAPQRRSLRQGWVLPFARLLPDRFPAVSPAEMTGERRLRTIVVWVLALCLGWLAYHLAGFNRGMVMLSLYAWYFLAIAVIDIEHRLVLNRMLLAGLPLILIGSLLLEPPNLLSLVSGAAIGFLSFLLLAVVSPGAMGMGDVKLAGWIGLALGFPGVIPALSIAVFSGGLAGLTILIAHRFRRGIKFAYAPYLSLGAWAVLFFHPQILPF